MYQMTLFFKKVIYKNNNCLISTHQKISNCTLFFNLSWDSMSPDPPSKGHGLTIMWRLYVQRIALAHANLHFRKKILTPYQYCILP